MKLHFATALIIAVITAWSISLLLRLSEVERELDGLKRLVITRGEKVQA